MSFYVSTATFFLLHCDEWDRVVALPRHKFVTGATLLQLGIVHVRVTHLLGRSMALSMYESLIYLGGAWHCPCTSHSFTWEEHGIVHVRATHLLGRSMALSMYESLIYLGGTWHCPCTSHSFTWEEHGIVHVRVTHLRRVLRAKCVIASSQKTNVRPYSLNCGTFMGK